MPRECPECGKSLKRGKCPECGWKEGQSYTATRCWFDGGALDTSKGGFCGQGNGWPVGLPCPFVCPLCRQRLDWSGACQGCYGSATPGDLATWTFPGARHETHDENGQPIGDGQHWVKTDEPGRPAMTLEESSEKAEELGRLLAMIGHG